jgi:hypothetical protein
MSLHIPRIIAETARAIAVMPMLRPAPAFEVSGLLLRHAPGSLPERRPSAHVCEVMAGWRPLTRECGARGRSGVYPPRLAKRLLALLLPRRLRTPAG